MSSIVQSSALAHQPPGRSVAVPFLPSPLQLMENGFPSVHFSPWCTERSHRVLNLRIWRMFKYSNAFIGKELLEQKSVVSWGIVPMQRPEFVLPEIRPLLPQGLSRCLSVNTNHVCNHSYTLPSLYLCHSSFSNPSVASCTPQFILQPFFRFSYVTSSSLNSFVEPPMPQTRIEDEYNA